MPSLPKQIYTRALAVLGRFGQLSFVQWETLLLSPAFERFQRTKYVIDICTHDSEPPCTRTEFLRKLEESDDDDVSDVGSPSSTPGALSPDRDADPVVEAMLAESTLDRADIINR